MVLKQILTILQIVIPIFLIVAVLFQQRGTALGSAFGGEGGFYLNRRGAEKKLFWLTIILGALFLIICILNIVIA